MWILESIEDIPFKKPLILLSATLGAGFLLLSFFLLTNPLTHPLTYALIALDIYLLHRSLTNPLQAIGAIAGAYALGFVLLPHYHFPFAACFALLIGQFLYRESFRIWKWLAASALFYFSFYIAAVWQQIPLDVPIPVQLLPGLHGMLFGFCVLFSFLAYSLRKDKVQEAVEGYSWKGPSESTTMAEQTREIYGAIQQQVRKREGSSKIKNELEEFSEKLIHICHRLQKISDELRKTNLETLNRQIEELEEKISSTEDIVARQQYQHTLGNKKKQKEQYENLRLQAERLRAQVIHYISALENMRFAYTNQEFSDATAGCESIEFFLHMAETRAENVYQTSEAYQKLLLM